MGTFEVGFDWSPAAWEIVHRRGIQVRVIRVVGRVLEERPSACPLQVCDSVCVGSAWCRSGRVHTRRVRSATVHCTDEWHIWNNAFSQKSFRCPVASVLVYWKMSTVGDVGLAVRSHGSRETGLNMVWVWPLSILCPLTDFVKTVKSLTKK